MPPTCPHELRPGTTVCLHCRREARLAARARVGRAAAIVGGGAFAIAIVVGMGVSIVRSMRAPKSSTDDGALVPAAIVAPDSTSSVSVALASPPPPSSKPASASAPPPDRASRPADPPVIAPTISQRTELGGGVFATREGSTVHVSFDTPSTRTRRRDKFERVLRNTLPRVYGPGLDAMLARIPTGELIPVGMLPVDLVTRGMRVPAGGGWLLTIWPETRPGRDGPLVVAYRATLTR